MSSSTSLVCLYWVSTQAFRQRFEWALGLPTPLIFKVLVLRTMPPKGRRSKALVKGSSSRTPKSVRDENLPINPPIQTPNIPKALVKTSIDGIHFNAFPKKSCRDLYTKVYRQRSFILERQLHLELFLNIPIPTLFAELGWLHWDCICSHCPYVLFEYY